MGKIERKTLLYILAGIAASAGTILYVAAYFWGGFLFLAAGGFIAAVRLQEMSREELVKKLIMTLKRFLTPVIGIAAAILIGGILMLLTGYNPVRAYFALFYGGFVRNWHISVLNAVPLIFTGLSVAFAFKAGLFNIGAEGQYYVGAMAATFLGIYLKLPPLFSLVLIFLFSGIIAASYNFIPAFLKVKTGAHEVITTMMFAHVARYLSNVFIRRFGGDPATSRHPYVTWQIGQTNRLPRFNTFLPNANYRLHTGILVAIGVAIFVYYILYHTRFGFEIRAVGLNKEAARTQGISIGKNIFIALLFAGFLAGLSGFGQVTGLDHRLYENLQAGYGWNGISVALLAGNHPIGVIFTSILWGALDAGGQYMSRTTQTPNSVVEIIKGIILFLIVAKYIYAIAEVKLKKRREMKAAAAVTAEPGPVRKGRS